jgi:hypothetical protein
MANDLARWYRHGLRRNPLDFVNVHLGMSVNLFHASMTQPHALCQIAKYVVVSHPAWQRIRHDLNHCRTASCPDDVRKRCPVLGDNDIRQGEKCDLPTQAQIFQDYIATGWICLQQRFVQLVVIGNRASVLARSPVLGLIGIIKV